MKLIPLAIALLPLSFIGCGSEPPPSDGPASPMGEGMGPMHVVCTSTALARSTAVGPIVRTTDAAGLMHLSVPIRAVTDGDITVNYRFTFTDANHASVDEPVGWQTRTLHAGTFEHVDGVAPSPQAADFELDLRYAQ